jgi:hypothetical protein
MNLRNLCLATVAFAALSPALATPADSAALEEARDKAPAEATLAEEIVASMRDLLDAVTPEISLPAVEIDLPTLLIDRG